MVVRGIRQSGNMKYNLSSGKNYCLNLLWFTLYIFRKQKILLTSVDQDLYGDGVDCQDEYVEILDGDTVDALSLGK